jgi:hypothetical protein
MIEVEPRSVVMQSPSTMRPLTRRPRDRRGIALVLTLILVFAVGALSMTAIYTASNAGLIGKMGEREKELRYSADAALHVGKSLLNNDPMALPDTGYRQLISGGTLKASDGTVIPNLTYNMWVGPTGSTTGQFGRFASVVSEAIGPRGARFVRRLELEQESFARYAYWSNSETQPGGGIIYFGGGDVLWGPVWSNDVITIHSTGATFHDDVGTAQTITSPGYATFDKGYSQNQSPITLPTITALAKLPGYATSGSLNWNAPTSGDETTVLMRLEYVAVDLNGDLDSTDVNEGFVRVYQANAGEQNWLRADYTANKPTANNCGDFHRVRIGGVNVWRFFPAVTHGTTGATAWARNLWITSGDYNAATANAHGGLAVSAIMTQALVAGQPAPRCFPGGDPHLVAVERNGNGGVVAGQIGGWSTTFTGVGGVKGAWKQWPGAVDPAVAAARPWDAPYLFPLYRAQNPGVKGVIYFNGTVGVSGTLRGRVTLYGKNTVVILDDLRYATDPAGGICNDIFGLIGGDNIVVADNGINTPQDVGAAVAKNLDDTKDLYVHGIMMGLNTSFKVQNHSAGPTDANDCGVTNWGRGCLYLTGGLIQDRRGAVGTTGGTGFLKRYSYDRCAVQIPPPYFPTTGRFLDNRYSEIDPTRFNVSQLFSSLTP